MNAQESGVDPLTDGQPDPWVALEARIRGLDDVLSVVLITDEAGEPYEAQVFTAPDGDVSGIQGRVRGLVEQDPALPDDVDITVLAVASTAASKRRAAGPTARADASRGRVEIHRVVAASTKERSAVQVILAYGGRRAGGFARDGTGAQGLNLAAQATVDAVEDLLDRPGWLRLLGTDVGERFGRPTVAVLVGTNDEGGAELLGAISPRDLPRHEAAVRATLDAINRQIALHLPPDQEP